MRYNLPLFISTGVMVPTTGGSGGGPVPFVLVLIVAAVVATATVYLWAK